MGVVVGKNSSAGQSYSQYSARSGGRQSKGSVSMASTKSSRRKLRGRLVLEKKVWFLGRFHASELNDTAFARLRAHVRIGKGIKTKIRLTTEGLYIGDRMGTLLKNKMPQEFIALQNIVTVRTDERFPNMLLIIVELEINYYEILSLKAVDATDANLLMSTYSHYMAPRKLQQQQQGEIGIQENWTIGRHSGLSYLQKGPHSDVDAAVQADWLQRKVTLPPARPLGGEAANGTIHSGTSEMIQWDKPRKIGTFPESYNRSDLNTGARQTVVARAQSPDTNGTNHRGIYRKNGDTSVQQPQQQHTRFSTTSDASDMSIDTMQREIRHLSSEVKHLKKASGTGTRDNTATNLRDNTGTNTRDNTGTNYRDSTTIVAEVLPNVRSTNKNGTSNGTPVSVQIEEDFGSDSTIRSVVQKLKVMDTTDEGKASTRVRDYRNGAYTKSTNGLTDGTYTRPSHGSTVTSGTYTRPSHGSTLTSGAYTRPSHGSTLTSSAYTRPSVGSSHGTYTRPANGSSIGEYTRPSNGSSIGTYTKSSNGISNNTYTKPSYVVSTSLDTTDSGISAPASPGNWILAQKSEVNNNSVRDYMPIRTAYAGPEVILAETGRHTDEHSVRLPPGRIARLPVRMDTTQQRHVRSHSNESLHARQRRVWTVRPDDEVKSEYGRPQSTRYVRPIEDTYNRYQAEYVVVGYRPRSHSASRFEKRYAVEPL